MPDPMAPEAIDRCTSKEKKLEEEVEAGRIEDDGFEKEMKE